MHKHLREQQWCLVQRAETELEAGLEAAPFGKSGLRRQSSQSCSQLVDVLGDLESRVARLRWPGWGQRRSEEAGRGLEDFREFDRDRWLAVTPREGHDPKKKKIVGFNVPTGKLLTYFFGRRSTKVTPKASSFSAGFTRPDLAEERFVGGHIVSTGGKRFNVLGRSPDVSPCPFLSFIALLDFCWFGRKVSRLLAALFALCAHWMRNLAQKWSHWNIV